MAFNKTMVRIELKIHIVVFGKLGNIYKILGDSSPGKM